MLLLQLFKLAVCVFKVIVEFLCHYTRFLFYLLPSRCCLNHMLRPWIQGGYPIKDKNTQTFTTCKGVTPASFLKMARHLWLRMVSGLHAWRLRTFCELNLRVAWIIHSTVPSCQTKTSLLMTASDWIRPVTIQTESNVQPYHVCSGCEHFWTKLCTTKAEQACFGVANKANQTVVHLCLIAFIFKEGKKPAEQKWISELLKPFARTNWTWLCM